MLEWPFPEQTGDRRATVLSWPKGLFEVDASGELGKRRVNLR